MDVVAVVMVVVAVKVVVVVIVANIIVVVLATEVVEGDIEELASMMLSPIVGWLGNGSIF